MDAAACKALLRDEPAACAANAPASRTAAAVAIAAARAAGARVVVLDTGFLWPGSPDDPLAAALRATGAARRVPVVLPLLTRANRSGEAPLPQQSEPADLPEDANVHLALPLVFADPQTLPDRCGARLRP